MVNYHERHKFMPFVISVMHTIAQGMAAMRPAIGANADDFMSSAILRIF